MKSCDFEKSRDFDYNVILVKVVILKSCDFEKSRDFDYNVILVKVVILKSCDFEKFVILKIPRVTGSDHVNNTCPLGYTDHVNNTSC